jgi:hypothetical protein
MFMTPVFRMRLGSAGAAASARIARDFNARSGEETTFPVILAGSSKMTYRGVVHHGTIVLPPGVNLPEGTEVQVAIMPSEKSTESGAAEASSHQAYLLELAERARSLPGELPVDFAINHDHYLYGTPKR